MQFASIYPGRYPGRTTHIHFRVRQYKAGSNSTTTYDDTTHLFYPEAVSVAVLATSSYKGSSVGTNNGNDRIYKAANEVDLTGSVAAGAFLAVYTINLPLTTVNG